MVKKSSQSSKATSLFEIRLKNLTNDVLIVKGTQNDAASVFLAGNIVLSLKEPMTVKGITLRLYATLNLHWYDKVTTSKGPGLKPNKFTRKLYEHTFDSVDFKNRIRDIQMGTSDSILSQNSGVGSSSNAASSNRPLMTKQHSSTSLKSFGGFRSKSSSSLANNFAPLSMHSKSSTNLGTLGGASSLPEGNHEFPFSAILPGNIPESVEGLPHGLVVYKLEAILERGKFQNNLVAKKHMRVIRTLTTDAVELSETVAVDNTWPNKVEYSLNVPQKAIALGSSIPISFMLVPLLKGLRLGDIKIELVEQYTLAGYLPPAHQGERILRTKTIPSPSEDDPNFQLDRWEVTAWLRVPDRLSKCTQDCEVSQHLKVKHKLKFGIGLINPDNHVSELRASLPVQLFISPFIVIRARQDDESETSSLADEPHNNGTEEESASDEEGDNEFLFAANARGSSSSLNHHGEDASRMSRGSSTTSFNGLVAPPIYEKHALDRLWLDVSPIDSPLNSGTQTPHSEEYFGLLRSPLDGQKLTENLRQLSLQQNNGSRAVFNFDDDHQDHSPLHNVLSSALLSGAPTPPVHLSRAPSESVLNSSSMVQVPSYDEALRSDTNEELLSPAYEPPLPGSHINMAELSRRLEELRKPSSGPNSRNSSTNVSPRISRNVSHSNLSGSGGLSRGSTKSPSNSTAPVAIPPALVHAQSQDAYHSVSQLSNSASERKTNPRSTSSMSLNNLAFLHKKHK